MDVDAFENNVFNYTEVISECYELNELDYRLYLPRLDNEEMKLCIDENK